MSANPKFTASVFAKGLIFPTIVTACFYLFARALDAGVPSGLALFGLSAGSMAVVAALEVLFPLRRDWAWWTDRQTFNDLVHGVLMSTAGPALGAAALASAMAAGVAAVAAHGGGIWPTHWSFVAQFALFVTIAAFIEWGKHWLYHHWSVGWAIHALHHNPDRLHTAKAGRLHFLESTIRYALITAPLVVAGAPGEMLIWYGAMMTVLGNLNHSNVDMPMPGFVHYLFASPAVHRLHHSIDVECGSSNLSSGIMLPDLLFGTFRHPDRYPLIAAGIAEDPIPGDLIQQVASPFAWPWLVRRARGGVSAAPNATVQA